MGLLTLAKRLVQGTKLQPWQFDRNMTLIENALNGTNAAMSVALNPNGTIKAGALNSSTVFGPRVVDQNALVFTRRFYCVDGGISNALQIATTSGGGLALSAYAAGIVFYVKVAADNSGATTMKVDALAPRAVKVYANAGLIDPLAGNLKAGGIYVFVDDGTQFVLVNPTPLSSSVVQNIWNDPQLFSTRVGSAVSVPHSSGSARPLWIQWSLVCNSNDYSYSGPHLDELAMCGFATNVGVALIPAFTAFCDDFFMTLVTSTVSPFTILKTGDIGFPRLDPTKWRLRLRWGTTL